MDSSDIYEGKKEKCTVMCYEFIKDQVPTPDFSANATDLGHSNKKDPFKDMYRLIHGYNNFWSADQQIFKGQLLQNLCSW